MGEIALGIDENTVASINSTWLGHLLRVLSDRDITTYCDPFGVQEFGKDIPADVDGRLSLQGPKMCLVILCKER